MTFNDTSYDYLETMNELINKYHFEKLSEGGFGVIVGNDSCVVKLVKDISRCSEMTKEQQIYQRIEDQRYHIQDFAGKIPKFHIFSKLKNFCHFNMERIFSPFSGFGDMMDDEEKFGHGYVISDHKRNKYLFKAEHKEPFEIDNDEVYLIGRHGKLAHFYVNCKVNPYERSSLDNNQGILMGQNTLENLFTPHNIQNYVYSIGQIMGFLIFQCNIVPTDVEVVIASRSKNDRTLCPYIYDKNISDLKERKEKRNE